MSKPQLNPAQLNFFDEIIVDNFAGGGGASTGIELATGRPVTIAINHDPAAILMHQTNHPYTKHLQASVWDVNPQEVCEGRPVKLAWFSPDCKHFSKAKGAALVDRNIRGLAWIVLRWAGTVRPSVIILENVEEFQTWGPVRKGKPVKSKSGTTFARWKQQLEALGYAIEHRELVAADYGAPTIRKRFVLIARCDGRPIVWPERTHAPADSDEVKSGKCKPWVSAAEIIDWTVPAYSIFQSRQEIKEKYGVTAVRPLAENTLRRIIRGVDKFTIKSGKPFIVPTGYGERKGQAPRVHDIDKPVVSTTKQNLCQPILEPFIVECNHSGDGHTKDTREPYGTITAKHTGGLVNTVMAPITVPNTCNSVGTPVADPVYTVTSAGNQLLTAAQLIQYHTEQSESCRANSLKTPINTVDASNRYGLTCANLVEYFSTGRPISVEEPMHTVTSHDREGIAMTHIVEFKGQDIGQPVKKPLRTITASAGEFAVANTIIGKYRAGTDLAYWPQVRTLLNKHCGYRLQDDEVLLIIIGTAAYYIADITLRMLTPRELYRAMGFPSDYRIDLDYTGKVYPKSQQVARCGNAVCPPMAEAVVRANLPEWCKREIRTMAELESGVAI